MARSVTLQSIADRARVHADMRETTFIDDDEMLGIINEVWPELYDELVAVNENYYVTTGTLTLTPGTDTYALPADCYKLISVDFKVANDSWISLFPFGESERNASVLSQSSIPSGQVRIRYVPAPTTFTSLSQSLDGISGWDRLLSLLVAIDMLDAEESDSSPVYRKYTRTLKRIQEMAPNRDQGIPARVADMSTSQFNSIYARLRYRMYGNNIQFINTEYLGVFD